MGAITVKKFTDRTIAALRPKADRYDVKELGGDGLCVRVGTSGKRSFVGYYHFDGRSRKITYGAYADPQTHRPGTPASGLSLASARIAHAKAKAAVVQGIDPGSEKLAKDTSDRAAETISDMVHEYIERHAKPRMKPSTAAEDQRILNREIIPHIGKTKAKDVTRRDLIKLLDNIEDRGAPVLRNRVAGVMSRFFLFGLDRGIVPASPATGIRRLEEKPRDRFLSMGEIHSFWHGLEEIDAIPQVRAALRMTLATGQRRFEVSGVRREEISDSEAIWRLPSVRSKNGIANTIPLPPFIMALVAEADVYRVRPAPTRTNRKDRKPYDPSPSAFLFPARVIGKPLEPAALTRALNRNRDRLGIGDATIHDLRRTFATAHGSIGTSKEIRSALLNHAPDGITARVYDKSAQTEPTWLISAKRNAMERYCDWLQHVIEGEFEEAKKMEGGDVVDLAYPSWQDGSSPPSTAMSI